MTIQRSRFFLAFALHEGNQKQTNKPGVLMKTSGFLLTFVVGALIGAGVHWYMTQPSHEVVANARENVRQSTTTVGENVREGAAKVGDKLKDTFDSEKIKDELARTGKVVREKAHQAGEAIADATANARTTAAIKTKLVADTGLAAFKIDVDTSDGVVTLSGSVSSPEDIAKAMKIAMEQNGVHQVVSTLTIKPPEVKPAEVTPPEAK
jgi:hyperosmotically inducible protein